jgi:anthranilate synthase/phosphoribosyltransferase
VYEKRLMEPVALAAHLLGAHHVMVVCSQDGYDEISPSAPTDVLEIDREGNRHFFVIHPSDYGFSFSADQSVRGGDSKENVRIAQTMLTGDATDIYSAAVLLNTGAALLVSEAVSDLGQGIIMARKALLEGTVSQKIEQIRQATHA